jgi:hypothetical protein
VEGAVEDDKGRSGKGHNPKSKTGAFAPGCSVC